VPLGSVQDLAALAHIKSTSNTKRPHAAGIHRVSKLGRLYLQKKDSLRLRQTDCYRTVPPSHAKILNCDDRVAACKTRNALQYGFTPSSRLARHLWRITQNTRHIRANLPKPQGTRIYLSVNPHTKTYSDPRLESAPQLNAARREQG
jgi:hypothetical protein